MTKLKKLDDTNSLFISVSLQDGTRCLYTGSMQEISDSLGLPEAPWFEKSLLDIMKMKFDGCEVKQLNASEARLLMQKIQDSKSELVIY